MNCNVQDAPLKWHVSTRYLSHTQIKIKCTTKIRSTLLMNNKHVTNIATILILIQHDSYEHQPGHTHLFGSKLEHSCEGSILRHAKNSKRQLWIRCQHYFKCNFTASLSPALQPEIIKNSSVARSNPSKQTKACA